MMFAPSCITPFGISNVKSDARAVAVILAATGPVGVGGAAAAPPAPPPRRPPPCAPAAGAGEVAAGAAGTVAGAPPAMPAGGAAAPRPPNPNPGPLSATPLIHSRAVLRTGPSEMKFGFA